MGNLKKTAVVTGRLIYPINIGMPAYIAVSDGVMRTSTVLDVQEETPSLIYFETRNTLYTLHINEEDTTGIIR